MMVLLSNFFSAKTFFQSENTEKQKSSFRKSSAISGKVEEMMQGPESEITKGNFLYPDRMKRLEDTYRTVRGRCYDFCFRENDAHFSVYLHSSPEKAYSKTPQCICGYSFQDGRIDPASVGCTVAIHTYRQARKIAARWAEHVDTVKKTNC